MLDTPALTEHPLPALTQLRQALPAWQYFVDTHGGLDQQSALSAAASFGGVCRIVDLSRPGPRRALSRERHYIGLGACGLRSRCSLGCR